jgi:plasmid stabilization system protein ParE
MSYTIIWSEFSENQLDDIFYYYSKKVSKKTALKIIQRILSETTVLENSPFIGQIEKLLIDRKITYRYLICTNYKIIYSINEKDNLIKIADIFDTRQNPIKIKGVV